MIVPEKTQQVRKVVIPQYVFNGAILASTFLIVLAVIMVLDYANVMNQISENRQLKVENRQLRQSIQVFKNKMVTIENTMDRVKTFVTKLRIITNVEDQSGGMPIDAAPLAPPSLPLPPMASPQQPQKHNVDHTQTDTRHPSSQSSDIEADTDDEDFASDDGEEVENENVAQKETSEQQRTKRKALLAALMSQSSSSGITLTDADNSLFVQSEFEKLDAAYDEVNKFVMQEEQDAQNLLEKLSEKRTILASTPTRIPTLGYITSDYGVRISPYDGRRKMHEGIDIANRYGADINAPADGVVVFAGVKPGYGKMVILDHGNGIETRYAHSSKFYVTPGQRVKRGQAIAAVGNTGHSTGPHVHYEVQAGGMPVDPCWYILDFPAVCRSR